MYNFRVEIHISPLSIKNYDLREKRRMAFNLGDLVLNFLISFKRRIPKSYISLVFTTTYCNLFLHITKRVIVLIVLITRIVIVLIDCFLTFDNMHTQKCLSNLKYTE